MFLFSFVSCGASLRGDALAGRAPADRVGEMRVYRDFAYGPRADAPDEGAGYKGEAWEDSAGRPIHTHRSGQLFDVYLPCAPERLNADAPVFLYLHGGSWCQRWDKDAEGFWLLKRLADRGFVVCSMDYILQNDVASTPLPPARPNATFADMLRDIDAMVTHLKTFLPSIGVQPRRLAIGGGSAGAHLASLYACDEGNPAVLGLGLAHAIPIAFAVDIVGPVDLMTMRGQVREATSAYVKRGTAPDSFAGRVVTLFGRLTGTDLYARAQAGDEAGIDAVLRKWSPRMLVTPRTPPFILAYLRLHPFAATDGIVAVSNCTEMEEALEAADVPVVSKIVWFRAHGDPGERLEKWIAEQADKMWRR